jgi:hypothetical protein
MIDIIFGIIIGIIVYIAIIHPYAYNTCLFSSGSCVKIKYQTKNNNTALIHILPEGKTVWFNGRDVLLYGEPIGQVCEGSFEPVYVFDLKTDTPKGYVCAKALEKIKKLYEDAPEQYLYIRSNASIGMANLIDILVSNNIISIDHL